MATYSAGTASVDIKPDFRNFVKSLRADLERVKAELGVDIKPAMAGFGEELRRELDRINARLNVDVSPDTAGFARTLEAELSRVQASVAVDVEADEGSLNRLQQTLQARLAGMDLTATVQVDADTVAAARDITALREAAGRPVTVDVDADTSAAAAQIAALQAASVTVGVGARGGGRGMSSGLITGAANLGALGIANIPAMATGLASIGADLQAITQSAALLPGIFTGAAAAIGTLAVGFEGMKDAFSDSPKKVEEAMSKMADSAKDVVNTIRGFGDEWTRVRTAVQGTLFEGVSEPLGKMINAQLPVVERGMVGISGKFSEGFKIALGELGSERSTGALATIFGNTEDAAGRLNSAILPIMNSIRTLATTGSTFLPQMAQGFTDAATKFDAFITKANESGDLARWMKEGIDAVKTFGSIVGNLGSSLSSIFRAVKGDGDGFLVTVDRLTERMATFLKSSEGQSDLRSFFAQGREQMAQWEPILGNIGSILKAVYEASQTWAGILMPFLEAASGLLADHKGLVEAALVAWLAWRTIGGILGGIQTAIAVATTRVVAFQTAAAAASTAGAGALSAGVAGLGAALGPGALLAVGIGAAVGGLMLLQQRHQDAKQAAEEQQQAEEELGRTLQEQSGAVTRRTVEQAAQSLGERGFLDRAESFGFNTNEFVEAGVGLDPEAKKRINDRLTTVILEETNWNDGYLASAFDAGLSRTTIAQALQGVPEAVQQYDEAVGPDGAGLDEIKRRLNDTAESAATLGGELNNTNSVLAQMGEDRRQINEATNGIHELTTQGTADFQALGIAIQDVMVLDGNTIQIDTPTEEQKAKLLDLGRVVEELPDGSLVIDLHDDVARAGIAEIVKPETKTVTVTVEEAKAALGPYAELYNPVPKAQGGPIVGGIPGRDSVPLLGMPGEHMLTTSDVDKLGGQAGVYRFRAALQAGLVRGYKDGGAIGWSEKDEIKLQQAYNKVTQAQEKANQVRNDPDSKQSDIEKADLAVREAQYDADQLEAKKTGGPGGELAPQAPLPERMSETEIDRLNAQSRVDQANTERNRIYADPYSTDEQKRAADRDYASAQNALEKQGSSGGGGDAGELPAQYSVQGIFARAGAILGQGLLSFFGLENSILSESNVYNKAINDVHAFYSGKAEEEQGQESGGGYSYQPQNLPQEKESTSSSDSGTSTGGKSSSSTSDHSYDSTAGVEQWRGTFTSVLSALGLPTSWVGLGLQQMQTESGGNPRAINNWDINAQNGTPSKGLMQVIDPTFASYRSPMYPNDIWDPGANIAAALRYLVDRYGGPEGVWGQGHGYDLGGLASGLGLMPKYTIKPERVLSPRQTEAFEAMLPVMESISAGLQAPNLPAGLTPRGGDVRNVTRDHSVRFEGPVQVMDVDHLMREQDRWSSFQAQGAMAAL